MLNVGKWHKNLVYELLRMCLLALRTWDDPNPEAATSAGHPIVSRCIWFHQGTSRRRMRSQSSLRPSQCRCHPREARSNGPSPSQVVRSAPVIGSVFLRDLFGTKKKVTRTQILVPQPPVFIRLFKQFWTSLPNIEAPKCRRQSRNPTPAGSLKLMHLQFKNKLAENTIIKVLKMAYALSKLGHSFQVVCTL